MHVRLCISFIVFFYSEIVNYPKIIQKKEYYYKKCLSLIHFIKKNLIGSRIYHRYPSNT